MPSDLQAPPRPAPSRAGEATGALLAERLRDHAGPARLGGKGLRVLDFGAGGGAVACALAAAGVPPTDACEGEAAALAALSGRLPAVRCALTPPAPPLPYPDATFDAVYAASAFVHLPPSAGRAWLHELARVMKEGAVALILVCGPAGVRWRRERGRPGWLAVADEDLARTGALFMPLGRSGATGAAAYSHAHLLETWDPILSVEAIYAAASDAQDLLVLRRPAAAPRPAGRRRAAQALWQSLLQPRSRTGRDRNGS